MSILDVDTQANLSHIQMAMSLAQIEAQHVGLYHENMSRGLISYKFIHEKLKLSYPDSNYFTYKNWIQNDSFLINFLSYRCYDSMWFR